MQEDFKEMKADVKELLQRSAVHNQLLLTHEQRSLALQAGQDGLKSELAPIKEHVKYVGLLLKVTGGVAISVTSGVAVKAILALFI